MTDEEKNNSNENNVSKSTKCKKIGQKSFRDEKLRCGTLLYFILRKILFYLNRHKTVEIFVMYI